MKTIDEAINYAAGNLPFGYTIDINIENSGYCVHLNLPDGGSEVISEESIIDDIVRATDSAREY